MKLAYNSIKDKDTHTAFKDIEREINSFDILKGKWKFYDITLKYVAPGNIKRVHGLSFQPIDVIMLYDSANKKPNVTFDKTYLYITIVGDCRLRFLAGRYEENIA